MCNTVPLFLKYFSLFLQLYIAKVPIGSGSGENFLDPAKKVRIRNPDRCSGTYLRAGDCAAGQERGTAGGCSVHLHGEPPLPRHLGVHLDPPSQDRPLHHQGRRKSIRKLFSF